MPCPCPPPKETHNCPCNSLQFMLNIDAGQSVNPNDASQYGYIEVEETDSGYKFTPKDGVTPDRDTIYYDYVKIDVNGETLILPFNITKSEEGKIVIIGPDLSRY